MKRERQDLGDARIEILEYIVKYITIHGYSPSIREIANDLNYSSTSSVHNHLNCMLNMGILETDAKVGCSRALRVPGYKFVKQ